MSQTYPVPAEGAEWNEANVYLESLFDNHASIRIEVEGDTIIDSLEYSKLFLTWSATFYQDGPCHFQFLSGPVQSNSYLGAVRTDEKQQVLYIPGSDTLSYIIYDFSLSVGDTINWDRPEQDFKAYVFDIDSLLIGSTFRKRINLGVFGNLPDQWIEGIGSAFGFFSTFGDRSWEKVIHELMCYRDNHIPQLFFHNYDCSMCDIVTSLVYQSSDQRLIIYPNPMENHTLIEVPEKVIPTQLRVYDLSGRLVYFKTITGFEPIKLYRKDFKRGIHFLEIIDKKNKSYREKLLIN